MLGYLIFDSDILKKEIAELTISKLLTFKIFKRISAEDTEIFIIENQHSNNYILESKRFLLCAVGTLIYNSFKGNDALKMIIEELNCGKNMNICLHIYWL